MKFELQFILCFCFFLSLIFSSQNELKDTKINQRKKACANYYKKYYQANKEKLKLWHKNYYHNPINREKINATKRKYERQEKRKLWKQNYYTKDVEKWKELQKKYNEKTKMKRKKDPEKWKKLQKKYNDKTKMKKKEEQKNRKRNCQKDEKVLEIQFEEEDQNITITKNMENCETRRETNQLNYISTDIENIKKRKRKINTNENNETSYFPNKNEKEIDSQNGLNLLSDIQPIYFYSNILVAQNNFLSTFQHTNEEEN